VSPAAVASAANGGCGLRSSGSNDRTTGWGAVVKRLVALSRLGTLVALLLCSSAQALGFGPNREHATGVVPVSMVVGDFNRDGKQDLATVNLNDNTASILLNATNPRLTSLMPTRGRVGATVTKGRKAVAVRTKDGRSNTRYFRVV
jgi:hypothetical protein